MRYEEVTLSRDCEVVQIPQGNLVTLPAGTEALITQALGDSFTIQVPALGGLFRINGKDADAIGQEPPSKPVESAAGRNGGPVDEELIWEQLRKVYDPEIPVNIYELGLIYELNVTEAGGVQIMMTLTAPNCPVAGSLPGEVERKVRSVPGVADVKVELVWDPPWDRDRMSQAALVQLGLY